MIAFLSESFRHVRLTRVDSLSTRSLIEAAEAVLDTRTTVIARPETSTGDRRIAAVRLIYCCATPSTPGNNKECSLEGTCSAAPCRPILKPKPLEWVGWGGLQNSLALDLLKSAILLSVFYAATKILPFSSVQTILERNKIAGPGQFCVELPPQFQHYRTDPGDEDKPPLNAPLLRCCGQGE